MNFFLKLKVNNCFYIFFTTYFIRFKNNFNLINFVNKYELYLILFFHDLNKKKKYKKNKKFACNILFNFSIFLEGYLFLIALAGIWI